MLSEDRRFLRSARGRACRPRIARQPQMEPKLLQRHLDGVSQVYESWTLRFLSDSRWGRCRSNGLGRRHRPASDAGTGRQLLLRKIGRRVSTRMSVKVAADKALRYFVEARCPSPWRRGRPSSPFPFIGREPRKVIKVAQLSTVEI